MTASPIYTFPVAIPSGGALLAARLHRNVDNLVERQSTVLVSGSWLTVKEQMPAVYAAELVRRGYTVLTFDFAGFGESGGEPRQLEMPLRKIDDIVAVARFACTLTCVRAETLGYLAICASAQYASAAIVQGAPIRSLVSVAGWFHDAASVAAYYGGEDGVKLRLARAARAAQRHADGAAPALVPAYEAGNEHAAMFIDLPYYALAARGAVPAWRNAMHEMSWMHWLTFDGLTSTERLELPTLFVHGDGCALPDNVKRIHARLNGPKRLIWESGFQTDFYDQSDRVALSVEAADAHFRSVA